MTLDDFFDLVEDSESWNDAADWKDNCARISSGLYFAANKIRELKRRLNDYVEDSKDNFGF